MLDRIRPAGAPDAAALSALAIETFCDAFGHSFGESDLAWHLERNISPDAFAAYLRDDIVLVATEGDLLVGYLQFGAARTPSAQVGDEEVKRLYVRRQFQRQGIGGQLLEAALNHPRLALAQTVFIETWEYNFGAQRLYRRCGFEVIGRRKFEVESGAETSDELIMARRNPDNSGSPLRILS